jgi:hypothetical protein
MQMTASRSPGGSNLPATNPARRAPATPSWLPMTFGVVAAGAGGAFAVGSAVDRDGRPGEDLYALAAVAVVLGAIYFAHLIAPTAQVREAFRLGRLSVMLEAAQVRSRRARRRGRTPAAPGPSVPMPRTGGASGETSSR